MVTRNSSYKQFHENFMRGHNGTTIWETLAVITPSPILVFFVCFLKCAIYSKLKSQYLEKLFIFLLEFSLMVLPLILICTIFSQFSLYFLVVSVLIFTLIMCFVLKDKKKMFLKMMNTPFQHEKRPHITYFRSIVSLYSAICILAVDFKIFPRRFAKTESFGYGLMDTGVGFFILSNGIVVNNKNRKNLLKKAIVSSIPIIALGIIRAVSVEKLDYQKHVSEYGVYWNFFFTLAVVKFLGSMLTMMWPKRSGVLALTFGFMHQLALTGGLQDWILSDIPRDDFLSANREGILSLPGYLSLYLTSIAVGSALRSKSDTLSDALSHTFRLTIGFLVFLGFTNLCEDYFGVSRRLANFTYILWMVTMCLLVFGISLLVEVALRVVCISKKISPKNKLTPNILEAINFNGLIFFLISNIFTGLINLSIQTLNTSSLNSFFILNIYSMAICLIMQFLYSHNIKIKFW